MSAPDRESSVSSKRGKGIAGARPSSMRVSAGTCYIGRGKEEALADRGVLVWEGDPGWPEGRTAIVECPV